MKSLVLFITLFACRSAMASVEFMRLFTNSKPVIAAIMIPSTYETPQNFEKSLQWTLDQAAIARQGKMDGLLLEFRGGRILDKVINDESMAKMTQITQAVIQKYPELVVGVEILWHFPGSTLVLAKNSGAKFVRIDFFNDKVVADDREVPIDPAGLLAYRKALKAENIALLTDIQVKYSEMIDRKKTLARSAQEATQLGSDGVIVSGTQSGQSPAPQRLSKARQGIKRHPLLIGSGFSQENAPELLPLVDAVIVGTSISEKTGGPLVPAKVQALMKSVETYRQTHRL